MKKLYVGNLDYSVTSQDLADLFSAAGAISDTVVISDRFSGRSKGFGFVEMDDEAADKAIEMFNGQDHKGRKLVVNEARPKEPQRGGGNGGGRPFRGGSRQGGGFQNRQRRNDYSQNQNPPMPSDEDYQ